MRALQTQMTRDLEGRALSSEHADNVTLTTASTNMNSLQPMVRRSDKPTCVLESLPPRNRQSIKLSARGYLHNSCTGLVLTAQY